MSEDLPDPTGLPGLPHPRETRRLIGQEAAEAEFLAAQAGGRLHSGWLLTGPMGVGKATLAYRIAAHLLAGRDASHGLDMPDDDPDLRRIRAGSHPRLFVLKRGPNDKGDRLSAQIRVEEMRKLKSFFHLSSTDGGHRAVIVDAADEMNVSAANALLKELEEPPANTTLMLIAHQPSGLLPTIRSRCRVLRLRPLAPDALSQALAQAGVADEAPEALSVLAAGSVGGAARIAQSDGRALYAALVALLSGLPHIDRPRAIAMANACAGKGAEAHFALMLDLIDLLLTRAARAGLMGAPEMQGAEGEARLLAMLAPDARAARRVAELSQELSARARHGRAVNLDPSALLLDMLLRIEAMATGVAAA
ncbi:DNA polymerase III subunit delta' [Limimaricola cinnabarinus]|jgi:DNA polymerase-3 subunit delta'|uniref:DNA polymerase III subunit delta n=1 Tax=Limimaricola cinnabarinus TaxID=1125964 RepID=A0A2G1MJ26_9RHOB|nr:DNA polymerase III subunit delta' [Limimaricola cinnabarinus]PHP28743.1 DNA polymerase III subunit delta' [Limimaricola cinnabarinus]